MDYYYALLNSYQLLKQRKFKLSLKEGDEDAEFEEAEKVARAAFAGATDYDQQTANASTDQDIYFYLKDGLVGARGGPFTGRMMGKVASWEAIPDRDRNKIINFYTKSDDSHGAHGSMILHF